MARLQQIRRLHRYNACLLLVFLTAHLITHLAAVFGPDSQTLVMDALRRIYRAPIIEIPLIALFLVQIGLGLTLFWRRFRQAEKTVWSWVQMISGLYLAVFILNHIFLGILRGRTFDGIETGFHFVAATLVTVPIRYGFIPYYALAILALFCHLAAAMHWSGRSRPVTYGLILSGFVCACLIVGAYGGFFYPIDLPDAYLRYIEEAF